MYPYLEWPAGMRDALTRARPPSVVIGERLGSVAIESAGTNVGVELAVPGCGVELQIPTAELGELRLGKRRDRAFELFDSGHASVYTYADSSDPSRCASRSPKDDKVIEWQRAERAATVRQTGCPLQRRLDGWRKDRELTTTEP